MRGGERGRNGTAEAEPRRFGRDGAEAVAWRNRDSSPNFILEIGSSLVQ